MLLLDVNICLYAMRADSEHHAVARAWLEERIGGHEPVGVSEMVLAGVLRVSTHHRIFAEPSHTSDVMAFCAALLAAPAAIRVRSGPRHWKIFSDLVAHHRPRGNDVPDTYLAALALEIGATWVSADRAFARFAGLRLLNPLDGH